MATQNVHLQCLLGMQCTDFAIIAADQTNTQSIIIMKNDENKLHEITDKMIMGVVGDSGAAVQFTQFISKNLELYRMRNKYELVTPAAVHFARKNLADGLRNGNASMINMLVAGYDDKCGGQLFSLDFTASCIKVPFAVHGFGGHLSMGILDQFHKFNLTESEAYDVLKLCVHEIHRRLFISLTNFQVKVISKHGIKQLPVISSATYLQ